MSFDAIVIGKVISIEIEMTTTFFGPAGFKKFQPKQLLFIAHFLHYEKLLLSKKKFT